MVGVAVFAGPAAPMTAVGLDVACPDPPAFDAVMTIRSLWPTSAVATVWVDAISPEIEAQPLPLESQRCHWVW